MMEGAVAGERWQGNAHIAKGIEDMARKNSSSQKTLSPSFDKCKQGCWGKKKDNHQTLFWITVQKSTLQNPENKYAGDMKT